MKEVSPSEFYEADVKTQLCAEIHTHVTQIINDVDAFVVEKCSDQPQAQILRGGFGVESPSQLITEADAWIANVFYDTAERHNDSDSEALPNLMYDRAVWENGAFYYAGNSDYPALCNLTRIHIEGVEEVGEVTAIVLEVEGEFDETFHVTYENGKVAYTTYEKTMPKSLVKSAQRLGIYQDLKPVFEEPSETTEQLDEIIYRAQLRYMENSTAQDFIEEAKRCKRAMLNDVLDNKGEVIRFFSYLL